ncbi:uncharacterized protein [Spinacia oleracea]|uniref:Transposase-associated domain-containing protein n=1 Tax=Spinacia oleracea TaxID=3562 RepID=A0ABM3RQQ1_SPIOL|nr:uncharacterized protein LOC110790538 [Spinacia oleracea]
MDNGNKEWWMAAKWSEEYERGINEYIKRAFSTKSEGNQFCCPCGSCHYRYWCDEKVVRYHLVCNGFVPRADKLSELGMHFEREIPTLDADERSNQDDLDDDLVGLLHDAHDAFREGPNDEAKKFFQLLEGGQEELYPGYLVREAFPDAKLPKSFNEAKSALKVLGLNYTKIDACPNDCMLYWEENANATSCHVCDMPRWKSNDTENDTPLENGKIHRIPKKILRYFPIKRRLQRLFMCQETASYMTWHTSGRENDHLLQHQVDGKAWKEFDSLYPNFAEDPRNVKLGLATDGFSPFNSMSIAHSTWPVILINYNLPPCMDDYEARVFDDLKELLEFGLETYDSSSNQRFDMRAALMTTVSDFPAYAMLSGWSTKGYFACPDCHYDTDLERLPCSNKNCYRATRRFLDPGHPWRYNKRNFDGVIEERSEPIPLKGTDVEYVLRDFPNEFGKNQKKRKGDEDDPIPWRKMSILFQLPYGSIVRISIIST